MKKLIGIILCVALSLFFVGGECEVLLSTPPMGPGHGSVPSKGQTILQTTNEQISKIKNHLATILNDRKEIEINDDKITIFLNDSILYFDVEPKMINDRIMVPIRKIFESLGSTIEWDENSQTVTAIKDDKIIVATVDNSTIWINGKPIEIDISPIMINDRVLVPVRFISESLGATVEWNDLTKTVIITNDNYKPNISFVSEPFGYFKFDNKNLIEVVFGGVENRSGKTITEYVINYKFVDWKGEKVVDEITGKTNKSFKNINPIKLREMIVDYGSIGYIPPRSSIIVDSVIVLYLDGSSDFIVLNKNLYEVDNDDDELTILRKITGF